VILLFDERNQVGILPDRNDEHKLSRIFHGIGMLQNIPQPIGLDR
jgi:hypothetical protein